MASQVQDLMFQGMPVDALDLATVEQQG